VEAVVAGVVVLVRVGFRLLTVLVKGSVVVVVRVTAWILDVTRLRRIATITKPRA
jgi:hypothetical protein